MILPEQQADATIAQYSSDGSASSALCSRKLTSHSGAWRILEYSTIMKGFCMRRKTAAAFSVLLVITLVTNVASTAQQSATSATKPDAVLKMTNEVLKKVSELRKLEIKQPVKSGLKTKDEIGQHVLRDMNESNTPEEVESSRKLLLKLGLIKKDFNLREYMVQLLMEQIAGFYDPKTEEFFLAAWLDLGDQKTVVAHELVHALQDQHFDLKRFNKWPDGDSDAELAAHALIEGDATFVMFQYMFDEQGMKFDINSLGSLTQFMLKTTSASSEKEFPVLSRAPSILRESLQFPYVYGIGFVQEVFKNRSLQSVNDTYRNLPASTEQVIHPEKFLNGDRPVKVEMPDLSDALGKDWKKLDTDIEGEFGLQVVMAEYIDNSASRRAAEGWGGDQYALYEDRKTGALLFVTFTTWDAENDAREFFNLYGKRTEKRYNLSVAAQSGADARTYETAEGLASLEIKGKDVLIIEGAQNNEQLQQIAKRLWLSKKSVK
jgi:hypothetical protein